MLPLPLPALLTAHACDHRTARDRSLCMLADLRASLTDVVLVTQRDALHCSVDMQQQGA